MSVSAWFERYVDWLLRRRLVVVLTLFAVTLFWASQLPILRVDFDPDATLPQHHPYIQALRVLEERFGEKNLVVIGLFPTNGTVFTASFLSKVKRITKRVEEVPGIVRASYLSIASPLVKSIEADGDTLVVRPVMERAPESDAEVAEVRRRLFVNRFYRGTVVAADSSAAAVIANFRLTPETPGWRELYERLSRALAEEDDGTFVVHFGGPVAVASAASEMSEHSARLFPLAVVVIGLIHYEAFRTIQGLVLPLVTAVFAIVWSLGLVGFLRIPIDPFNTTTPILILAVAAGHAVQILKRYYEEFDRHGDTLIATRTAVLRLGPVMVTAGAIAALSFFSLAVFPTVTVRNFAILSGTGVLSALVLELTLIPALRALLPAPRSVDMAREARSGRAIDWALARVGSFVTQRPRTVVAMAVAIALCSIVMAMRIRVDTSFRRQFAPTHSVRVADRALNKAFAGTSTLALVVEGDGPGALHNPAVLHAIADLQRFIEEDPAVGKTVSVVDLLSEIDVAMKNGLVGKQTVFGSSDLVSQYLFLYSLSGGPEDLNSQIDPTHQSAVVRVFLHDDSTEYAQRLMARVRSYVDDRFPPGYRVQYSGTVASDAALTEVMVRGKILNIVQIATIIILISGLVFRSAIGGALVAAPLAMAVLLNFGLMGMLDVPLDIMTATIAAMAVGIGADYAVYFLFRFREELAISRTAALALASTLRTSGKAIIYVSSAIAAGYLVLCTSGLAAHIELGGMIGLAMIVSSVCTLTLLPALALLARPRFLFRPRNRVGTPSPATGVLPDQRRRSGGVH